MSKIPGGIGRFLCAQGVKATALMCDLHVLTVGELLWIEQVSPLNVRGDLTGVFADRDKEILKEESSSCTRRRLRGFLREGTGEVKQSRR